MTTAHTGRISVNTRGEGQMVDITSDAQDVVAHSGLTEGQCCLFVPGATGALTTIEYEPGLKQWSGLCRAICGISTTIPGMTETGTAMYGRHCSAHRWWFPLREAA